MTRWEALVTMCRILDLNKFPYTQQKQQQQQKQHYIMKKYIFFLYVTYKHTLVERYRNNKNRLTLLLHVL